MVLGLFEGSMDIVLDKRSFAQGEEIKGTAILRTGKPIKARSMVVSIFKEYPKRVGRGKNKIVFASQVIGGAKEYTSCEVPFTIRAPTQLPFDLLAFVFGHGLRLEAKLDMEAAFDVRKEIGISVKA